MLNCTVQAGKVLFIHNTLHLKSFTTVTARLGVSACGAECSIVPGIYVCYRMERESVFTGPWGRKFQKWDSSSCFSSCRISMMLPPPWGSNSAEGPHLQLQDVEVIGLRQAAVAECVTGTAAPTVQSLIQPQAKMATGRRQSSY